MKVANIIHQLGDHVDEKVILDRVVQQVWDQFEYGSNGLLDARESEDFLLQVLRTHEQLLA